MNYKGVGQAHKKAKVIATYDDGNVLAAEMNVGTRGGLVVSVNIFPFSNDIDLTGGWDNDPGNDVSLHYCWMLWVVLLLWCACCCLLCPVVFSPF